LFAFASEQIGDHHLAAARDDVTRERRPQAAGGAGDNGDRAGQLS
jgi:hypothetical protein